MAIVTGLTERWEIPHEPGQHMTLRPLSWWHKQKASDAQTDSVIARVKTMGTDVMKELRGAESRSDVQAAQADPLGSYDRALVLEFGIVEWSYEEKLSPEAIKDLDDKTAEEAARRILVISSALDEEARKNGSSPST